VPRLACPVVRPPANLPGSDGGKLAQHLIFCMSVSMAIALALVFVSARTGEVGRGGKSIAEKEKSELQARAGLNLHGLELARLRSATRNAATADFAKAAFAYTHTHTHNSCNERYYDQLGEV
jgi:hypothetical protein